MENLTREIYSWADESAAIKFIFINDTKRGCRTKINNNGRYAVKVYGTSGVDQAVDADLFFVFERYLNVWDLFISEPVKLCGRKIFLKKNINCWNDRGINYF
jgi:hypothetical protein